MMEETTTVMFGLILLVLSAQNGNCFPTSGMNGASPTGFYCFVMPDMTWQCKCPEAERVYVLYRFPQFALVCNSYNQLEFLSRAGSNHGDSKSWSPRETYAYQLKHSVNVAQSLGSWRGTSGADQLPKVSYNFPNSALNRQRSDNTDTTATSTFSTTSRDTKPTFSTYGPFSSPEPESSVEKGSTVWSSSTLPTTKTPKQELPPQPEEKPESKLPNHQVAIPEPTEVPPSVKSNKPEEEEEDKGCTYMGRVMKTGQSFKPPWGCTLYCNGNNSLFRKC